MAARRCLAWAVGIALARVCGADLDRCGACAVVHEALLETLLLEHKDEDRADILSGGRLDSTGKRNGATIKYATSEFRTSHLLSQLCAFAATYAYEAPRFVRDAKLFAALEQRLAAKQEPTAPHAPLQAATTEAQHQVMQLAGYCGAVVEEHEDTLAAAIVAGAVDDAFRERLCVRETRSCASSAALDAAAATRASAPTAAAAPPNRKKPRKKKKVKDL
ncbi:TLR4 regulator and MIR-interacting MSAP-domain-containing protein [Pelagophyceae sp. CCMP2097]|nr:TLR4 regulator and MIR-interacting MSAP-domain-containing protein [Pelagophyceae sp. CCMP2097]